MPSRLVCVGILLYWSVAAVALVKNDLLPELSVGNPPDLRTIASAGRNAEPARWSVQVIDNPAHAEARRSVGQAITESHRSEDGWVVMSSRVVFDSGRLLKGTPLAYTKSNDQIEFDSTYDIDPSGNLRSFHAEVRSLTQDIGSDLWKIDGTLKDGMMEVVSRGPLPFLDRTITFDYKARGLVQSQFGPLDRLPGLAVGQRWDERMANPFTGQVETVRAEVKRKTVIHWDQAPVTTLEVVHRSGSLSVRTWVRPDGLVLRQEIPTPLVRLVLERQPGKGAPAPPELEPK
jgi:hypothetical protein